MNKIEAMYRLSPMQRGMLFHSLYASDSGMYVEQISCTLSGKLDEERFGEALAQVVERHPILRTAFVWQGVDEPVQVVKRRVHVPLVRHDWRDRNQDQQSGDLKQLVEEERRRGFELTAAPLLRLVLVRTAEEEYRVVLSNHHLLLDGWSRSLVLSEVFQIYDKLVRSQPVHLPVAAPFKRYVAWLERQDMAAAEVFWRRFLAGFETPVEIDLGGPQTVAEEQTSADEGSRSKLYRQMLSRSTTARLGAMARRHGLTFNSVIQAAWALLLGRHSGRGDVVYGVTVSGRTPELDGIDTMVGLFINTLPMRVRLEPEIPLVDWFKRFQGDLTALRQVEYSPLAEVQGWSEVPGGEALFDTVVVFENYPVQVSANGSGPRVSDLRNYGSTNYPLVLVIEPATELVLALLVHEQRFNAVAAARILAHLSDLLEAFVEDPSKPLGAFAPFPAVERQQVLIDWNATTRPLPSAATIPALFARQVERAPQATAVVGCDVVLSYGELARRSRHLARHLRSLSVDLGDLVGLSMERCPEMIVALLGILEAGAAYVPLDTSYPAARLAFMLEDAAPSVVLGHAVSVAALPGDALAACGARVVLLDSVALDSTAQTLAEVGDGPLETAPGSEHLAYISYTSGSTGRPKGVEIPHRAVARLVCGAEWIELKSGRTLLQLSPVAFDASTLELWGGLLHGGSCVLLAPGVPTVETLGSALRRHRVDTLWLTASLYNAVIEQAPQVLRGVAQLLVGGEALSVHHVRKGLEQLPSTALLNGYGPTENTTFTCVHRLPRQLAAGTRSIPIGQPVTNTRAYVLNDALEPVAIGVEGELWAAGLGLARGYLNRPDLTAERFVPDPLSEESGGRLYATGDRVRWLADGTLEFLGRRDQQVKVRGFRIEPGEIEVALLCQPRLREAVVMVRQDEVAGKRLLAWVVQEPVAEGEPALTGHDLRSFLKQTLPEYMVPTAYVFLDSLPRTANGKLDRDRLPDPGLERAFVEAAYSPPRTPVEELVAQIWGELLGHQAVGVHDDFFELGGHSLLATQLVSRINKVFSVDLGLRTLFDAPTVAELVRHLEDGGEAAPPLEPASADDPPVLSFAQQRLWFIDQLVKRRQSYNIFAAIGLEGRLRVPAVVASLREIVRRHQVLRTTFPTVDGKPELRLHAASELEVPRVDLSALPSTLRQQEVERRTARAVARPFDLAQGPLLRVELLALRTRQHIALVGMHHIVSDGWSMGVLIRELGALYAAAVERRPSPLPELAVQYSDYGQWQRRWLVGEVLERQLEYWRDQLLGTPTLELPTDRPRPTIPSFRGGRRPWLPQGSFGDQLEALARRRGATLFMVLAAGFQILLARLTGQRDVVLGTPVANRNRAETEDLIGCFVNTLVLRSQLAEEASFEDALKGLREVALGAYTHQDVPFEKLVEELQPERDLSRSPLFQVVLVLQNTPAPDLDLEGLRLYAVEAESGTAKFDLTLTIQPTAEGLTGSMEYSADLFDAVSVDRLLERLERLLGAAVVDPRQRIGQLPLLSAAELDQLLHGWNNAAVVFPTHQTLHGRFSAQAKATPAALAVSSAGASMSYGELDSRANRLASQLIDLGVQAGAPVGLCLDRSLELVVGLLGVLKAGAVYLPLDHAQPADRLAFLVQDSGVELVVTTTALASGLPAQPTAVCLDEEGPMFRQQVVPQDAAPPSLSRSVGPEHLAYIIYTSGSTGQPKGVGVSHGNALRLMLATEAWFEFDPRDVWTLFHSYAFDFSVWELWGALLYGGRLVVVPYWVSRTPESFWQLVQQERVTMLNQTPSAFRQLIHAAEEGGGESVLRRVIFGGEALELESLRPWFERFGDQQPQLVNMYGITETTVHVTYRPVALEDVERHAGKSVLGVPITDLQLYVLDRRGRLLPAGAAGELCVGGSGVAAGYLGRPGLTAERFVPHPWSTRGGERLYRSGDLGRWLEAGEVEYLGRIDHQVKVRGFRIELGEIEAVLQRHEVVREVVVMVEQHSSGEPRLVAWLGSGGETPPSTAELRTFAGGFLPDYMVPAACVWLDTLPLTANGKIDRAALLEHGVETPLETGYTAPRSSRERTLAEIWGEVLGLPQVGIHDNFFTLGGDSILSIQVRSKARQQGLEFSLPQLFEHQTIARLVAALAAGGEDVADELVDGGPFSLISPQDRELLPAGVVDAYPLVRMQAGMLFHSDYSAEATAYHDLLSSHLRAPFDEAALGTALGELLAAHPVLCTSFDLTTYSEPLQLVHGAVPTPLQVEDLRSLTHAEQEQALEDFLARERQRQLPWDQPPLLAVWLHRRQEDSFQLTFSFHHAILDGWSLASALTELFQRYLALLGRGPAVAPSPERSFREFVALERQALGSTAAREYWDSLLDGAVPLELPELGDTTAAERLARLRIELLPEELSGAVLIFARSLGVPVKSVLLAAHLWTLQKLAGRRDVLTGVVSHGRSEESEGERVLGLFLNTVPFRFQLEPCGWRDLVLQVFRQERALLPHRRVPLAEITHRQGGKTLFDTAFNFVHFHVYRGISESSEVELLEGTFSEETHFRLAASFGLDLAGEQLQLRLEYDGRDFDEEGLGTLLGLYEEALVSMVTTPDEEVVLVEPAAADQGVGEVAAVEQAAPGRPYVAPGTPAEISLAEIWAEVLHTPRVGLEDNFFELGGDSILSLKVVARARQAGLRITPKEVFESGTLEALAAVARGQDEAAPAVAPKDGPADREPVALVPIQNWFFARRLPTPKHWNQSLFLEVRRPLVGPRLAAALGHLLRHHPSLCSCFLPPTGPEEGPRWVLDTEAPVPLQVLDLGALASPHHRGVLERAAASAQTSLDLENGPVLRVLLFQLGDGEPDRLLLIIHHLVVDGVSWRVLLEDLETAYQSLEDGQTVVLPPVGTSYRTWARRLATHAGSVQLAEQIDFWCRRHDGERPLPQEPGAGRNTAASVETVEVSLDREETAALLKEVPRAWRTGIDDALLSAAAVALCRFTGGTAVRVDLEGHGREGLLEDLDLSRTVGWFTALYPVVLEPGEGEVVDTLKRVKEQLRAVPDKGLGYGLLRYSRVADGGNAAARALAEVPAAEVSFNYLGQLDQALPRESVFRAASESGGATQNPQTERPYALEILGRVEGERLHMSWAYSRELHSEPVIAALAADFLATLRALITACRTQTLAGATPSDFPLAARDGALDQAGLDGLLAGLPEEVEDLYPLSPMQEGLLFESILTPDSEAYFEQFTYRVEGELDPDLFQRSWEQVCARHPVLRTAFVWQGLDRPLQAVLRRVELDWHFEDWRQLSGEEQEDRLDEFLAADRARGLDPAVAPVMRWLLVRRADQEWTVVWSHHHLLLDGWCLSLLTEDVFQLYRSLLTNSPPSLTRRRPYRDYIAWLEGQDLEGTETFWRRYLGGVDRPTPLVVDRPQGPGSMRPAVERRRLSAEETRALEEFGRSQRLTMSTLVHAAWGLLLVRYSGMPQALFGTVVAGRPADLEGASTMIGLFINTLPAVVRSASGQTVGSWLQALQGELLELRQVEYSPLARVQTWSEVPTGTPLFESLLAFENYQRSPTMPQSELGARIVGTQLYESTGFPLTLAVGPSDRLLLQGEYDSCRFDDATMDRLLGHLHNLLVALPAGVEETLADLPLLSAAEHEQVVVQWNTTAAPISQALPVHALVARQAGVAPEAKAVLADGVAWSYEELWHQVEHLAARLGGHGIGPETVVGLSMERSPELAVGLLGVLQAGAAYLPLDPAYPATRLRDMVENAGVEWVLAGRSSTKVLAQALGEDAQVHWLWLDEELAAPTARMTEATVHSENLAYLVYTSGSTGRPKGVLTPHGALVHYAQDMVERLGLGPSDRVLQFAPLSFDVLAEEVLPTWICGGGVVFADPSEMADVGRLSGLLERHGVTWVELPASFWHEWVDHLERTSERPPACLRQVLVGCDRPSPERLLFWRRFEIPVVVVFGLTETTITNTLLRSDGGGADDLPIGLPVANTQIYVLDGAGRPLGVGVPGEMWIGGVGVGRGYHGSPALTAERFWPDPFNTTAAGGRLYRTGDRARWRADGSLDFLGRLDEQAKVRGFRVEPAEVEAALCTHPGVREAVVMIQEQGMADRRLVAWVAGMQGTAVEELRDHLLGRLPDYMVPAAIVALERLPTTPSGKVDRRALSDSFEPALEIQKDGFVMPVGPVEESLAALWSELLGVPRVGLKDDFFLLGGHSLLATRLVSRVRQAFDVELPLRQVFETPTLAELALEVENLRRAGQGVVLPPLEAVGERQGLPLSFAQERLWVLDQLEPENPFYNMPGSVRVRGHLNLAAAQASLRRIVDRHEVLRTAFVEVDGHAALEVLSTLHLAVPLVDLSGLEPAVREATASRLAGEEARRPFRLSEAPLLRTVMLRLDEEEHAVLLNLHHIVGDAWSVGVLVAELGQLYDAFLSGRSSSLPALPIQYADFAHWQRQWLTDEVLEQQLLFWREALGGELPALDLPTDRPRPPIQRYRGAEIMRALPADLSAAVAALARSRGATLFMSLLAAFQALLGRLANQLDFTVGTPVANRGRREVEGLIGFFLNTLVLRANLGGNPTFETLLQRVRESSLAAYAHQDVPFERLVEELRPDRDLSRSPLFQVMFVLQNAPVGSLELEGALLTPLAAENRTAKFDLTFSVEETPEGLMTVLEYATDLYDRGTAESFMDRFERLLGGLLERPASRLGELPLLSRTERLELLEGWDQPACPVLPHRETLHGRFAAQAAQTPDAVAVTWPAVGDGAGAGRAEGLTYGRLAARAHRLAHLLRARGVAPGDLVGLGLERSTELVVAILAVLETGAAYVPLDTAQPAQRLAWILEDAAPRVVVTSTELAASLPAVAGVQLVLLDAESAALEALLATALEAPAEGGSLAYVIYTSGSTGRPKGVAVRHANALRLFTATASWFECAAHDVWTLFHSYAFDFSVWELWGALLHGGRLVVVPYWVSRAPGSFHDLLLRQRVTVLNQTPSAFRQLMAAEEANAHLGPLALRQVVFGGEALDPVSLGPWMARHGDARPRLVNMYGITETTVHVTWRVLTEADARPGSRSVIGQPISDLEVHVVDRWGGLAPVGAAGELWIGGAGLAVGYVGNGGLTASRFVPHCFGSGEGGADAGRSGARLYRSGDLGRRLPGGELEYLGRIDHQVKVRGFRIELGEIETALQASEAVREVVVLVHAAGAGDSGPQRLVAWVVAAAGHSPTPEGLREELLARLPEYMVPAAFVLLEELPLTVNGKLDRRALPDPEAQASGDRAAPRNDAEEALAGVWAEVLRLDEVGIHDNFFVLGGDSILGIQIVSRALRAGLRLSPKQLFQYQTIAELAAVAEEAVGAVVEEEMFTGEVPLLPIQRWFFDHEHQCPDFYNQAVLLAVARPLRFNLLRRVVAGLLEHHDMLRARFTQRQNGWHQEVLAPETVAVPCQALDLSAIPQSEQHRAVEGAAAALQQSLDLAAGPLLRIAWIDLGGGRPGRLFLVMHHLVVDGVSWRILLEDLEQAYDALEAGQSMALAPRSTSYLRWARELQKLAQGAELAAEAVRWQAEAAIETAPLPADLDVDLRAEGINTVASSERVSDHLDEETTRRLLQEVPAAYRTQIDDVLMTALGIALARWTGSDAVRVALEGHGREEVFEGQDLSRTVGWFTSMYPVVLEMPPGETLGVALKRVKETLRNLPRRGLGFGVLRYLATDEVRAAIEPSRAPEVSFNYLGQFDQALGGESRFGAAPESSGPVQDPRQRRPFVLEVDASVAGGCLRVAITYSTEVHREATVETLAATFVKQLKALVEHCTTPGVGGYTPSDFPLAAVDQATLDRALEGQILYASEAGIEDVYPLSPMQQGILIHTLYAPNKLEYFNQLSTKIHGALDEIAFRESWRRLAERHPIFRTAFVWEGLEEPLQVVHKKPEAPWLIDDWRHLSAAEQAEHQRRLLLEDTEKGLDPGVAPFMRFHMIRLEEDVRLLVWSHHHLLMDGWSIPVLFQDLFSLYQALATGEEPELEHPSPYRDYIAWLMRQDRVGAEAYWRRYLAGFTEPTALGLDRVGEAEHGEVVYASHQAKLPPDATAVLGEFSRRHQLTINTMVQAAWALLLSRYSSTEDVVYGTVVSGRPAELPGIEAMIGPFINALPVRVRVRPEENLVNWLESIQKDQIELRTYEFSSLMQIQAWSEIRRDGRPLFESAVAFENYPVDVTVDERQSGIYMTEGDYIDWNSYPISLDVSPGPELSILVKYSEARFDAAVAQRIAGDFEILLRAIPESAAAPVQVLLDRLAEAERQARVGREEKYESSLRNKLKGIKRRPRKVRGRGPSRS